MFWYKQFQGEFCSSSTRSNSLPCISMCLYIAAPTSSVLYNTQPTNSGNSIPHTLTMGPLSGRPSWVAAWSTARHTWPQLGSNEAAGRETAVPQYTASWFHWGVWGSHWVPKRVSLLYQPEDDEVSRGIPWISLQRSVNLFYEEVMDNRILDQHCC